MSTKSKKSGTYCLIVHVNNNSNIKIGKLGFLEFKEGYYVYVGSALNSLKSRINRHLSMEKKLFWHIDYLLNSENSHISDVIYIESPKKWECNVASKIASFGVGINGFGCSDCKCSSHLFYFADLKNAKKVCLKSFKNLNLKPKNLNDFRSSQ